VVPSTAPTSGHGQAPNTLNSRLWPKKELSSEDKQELLALIENYRKELVPPIIPMMLLRHHLRHHPVSDPSNASGTASQVDAACLRCLRHLVTGSAGPPVLDRDPRCEGNEALLVVSSLTRRTLHNRCRVPG
jgi:hypothetical protein